MQLVEEVSSSLAEIVRNISNIKILENHICVDLVTNGGRCIGAYVLNIESNKVITFNTSSTIIATGGASKFISIQVIRMVRPVVMALDLLGERDAELKI